MPIVNELVDVLGQNVDDKTCLVIYYRRRVKEIEKSSSKKKKGKIRYTSLLAGLYMTIPCVINLEEIRGCFYIVLE